MPNSPGKTPRVFAREFKLDVCRQIASGQIASGQIASGQRRPAQACREHQLTEGVLLRWRSEFERRGEDAFSPPEATPTEALERRVAELERLCGQLSLENALPKKLAGRSRSGSGTP